MSRKRTDLKILLLQIRDEPRVRQEEYDSFSSYSGLAKKQIDILNVFDTPSFATSVVDEYDSLFVGGASEASVLEPEKYPFVECGKKLMLYCIDKAIPTFASCFGFQLAVIALGGKLVKDKSGFEMGSVPIKLTKAAEKDPLFKDVSQNFMAISVHRERTIKAPPGCELLAYTDKCCHSFKVKNKPFWAFQFHPEVDKPTLIERLTIYKKQYTEDDAHLAEVLDAAVDTPEANNLVKTFVERVLLKKLD